MPHKCTVQYGHSNYETTQTSHDEHKIELKVKNSFANGGTVLSSDRLEFIWERVPQTTFFKFDRSVLQGTVCSR